MIITLSAFSSCFCLLLVLCRLTGTTIDWLISDAIEGADVMLYAVSLSCECVAICEQCVSMFQDVVSLDVIWPGKSLRVCMTDKESANCRLEANYAHQQELDMIPLKMTVRTIESLTGSAFR